ncbi:MAG TPA: ribosome biogenesis GTPase Der [Candidatus Paceibacterota bacterium]|nr:ribosome biogenesis GTPase Der [Verrucomicrobiota bacterium]HRY47849.1 ribosome biogenesis GTPase Der [Candidatus Paceibacterota bacterium]HSA00292.1 ribosome biogenesis GTPase Der [Candidatus Paceibacterota bacterium]
MSQIVAIVGRPNVGKSALFNRIAGRRIAIVHDQPGVTRDRITAECEWQGHPFTLVDTGGIGLLRGEKTSDPIVQSALKQVDIAIESAHLILLVVNAQEGLMPLDQEAANRLRLCGKQILLVANKVDNESLSTQATDFVKLGFPAIYEVSAIHGKGVDSLMEVVSRLIAAESSPSASLPTVEKAAKDQTPLKIAVVGRPNVGKSSIINALTRSERVIVSPIPGTTRDSVDVPFVIEADGQRESYLLIDTAGIRKERRIHDDVEFYSVCRAEKAIQRCDLAIFVLDAESGILEQDKKVADKILEERKACILVVNKWDLFADRVRKARQKARRQQEQSPFGSPEDHPMTTLTEFSKWVQQHLFFLDYAPVIFTSAHSGFNLDRLLEAVRYVLSQLRQKIPTAILNRTLHQAIENRQPVSSAGHRLKFFYATQVKQIPPTFWLFVNRTDLLTPPYERYLANELRRAFGYEGCPLNLVAKSRPRTIEPKRKTTQAKRHPVHGPSHKTKSRFSRR